MAKGNKRGILITESITTRESASFKAYLRDISQIDLFETPEKEMECALKVLDGNEKAKDELVRRNLRFVVSVAKKYQGPNASLEDLVNQGNMGLYEAAARFDPTRGAKFISYAVWYVRKEILLYISTNGSTIKLPSNRLNQLPKFNNAVNEVSQRLGREADIEDLIDNLDNYTEREIENLMEVKTIGTSSMDKMLSGDGDGGTLHDVLENPDAPATDSLMINNQNEEVFNNLLSTLTPKQEDVIRMYFGIGYEYGRNLDEIGTEMGVSRERVRQIKERSLRILRKKSKDLGVDALSF
jgi:RNA polymerase primary sigma factor